MYSQNEEEKFITEYFEGTKGVLLSIGENDGKTFSNSLRLIELGWQGILVEPSPSSYDKLIALHNENDVMCIRAAVGSEKGRVILHESGPHLKDKSDFSLLSTTKKTEIDRWKGGVEFNPVEVDQIPYQSILELSGRKHFDFITIDAEGMDVEILKQIDLTETKMICIEWNGVESDKKEILEYCATFGMTNMIYSNIENIILAR